MCDGSRWNGDVLDEIGTRGGGWISSRRDAGVVGEGDEFPFDFQCISSVQLVDVVGVKEGAADVDVHGEAVEDGWADVEGT